MLLNSEREWVRPHEVLLALRDGGCSTTWLEDVNMGFRPSGYVALGTFCDPDAIRRVERGGLAAAVLFTEGTALEGFSLLRIIRSISADLPCWLVATDPTPHTLQAALALRVHSVMRHPVEAGVLSGTVTRGLGLARFHSAGSDDPSDDIATQGS